MIYGYVRVSTEQQRDNWSTEVQREKIRHFAEKQGEEYKIYDEVKSGKNISARPEFTRLLDDIQRESFSSKKVWVVEQTRLARNVTDADYVCKLFMKHGVELYVNDNFNDLSIAGNRLIYGIQSVVAAHEREQTGERIRRSKEEAKSKGALRNSALIGYKRQFEKNGDTYWVIDESEAKVVRKIFQDYLDGTSVNAIAMELNRLGYKTKRNKRYESTTIAKILNHPYYFGLQYDLEGELVKSEVYAPLLEFTREEFLAQRALRKPHYDKFLYVKRECSGVIKCSQCGASYYIHHKVNNGISYSYLCHQTHRLGNCGQLPKYIDLEKNEKALLSFYEESLKDLDYLSKLVMRERQEKPDIRLIEKEAARITSDMERQESKKKRLMEALENGLLSMSDIKERMDEINGAIDILKKQTEETANKMREIYDPKGVDEDEVERRITQFRTSSVEDKHRALLKAIKSCVIDGNRVILTRSDREIFEWEP
jgi:site-specific DNA recombinase